MINVVYGSIQNPETGLKVIVKRILAKVFGRAFYWVVDPIDNCAKVYRNKKLAYRKAKRLVNAYGLEVTVVEQYLI